AGAVIAPRVYIGRSEAPVEGSFGSTATLYRRFRLNALFDYKAGHRQLDNNLRARCQVFYQCLANLDYLKIPARLAAQYQSPGTLRDFTYGHAGYTKLREVSASYTLPERLIQRLGASSGSLTVSGRNLRTWTKWTGVDPESFFTVNTFT